MPSGDDHLRKYVAAERGTYAGRGQMAWGVGHMQRGVAHTQGGGQTAWVESDSSGSDTQASREQRRGPDAGTCGGRRSDNAQQLEADLVRRQVVNTSQRAGSVCRGAQSDGVHQYHGQGTACSTWVPQGEGVGRDEERRELAVPTCRSRSYQQTMQSTRDAMDLTIFQFKSTPMTADRPRLICTTIASGPESFELASTAAESNQLMLAAWTTQLEDYGPVHAS
ncbi:hypothetical protein GGX14DRAFT_402868 [Mycena pura]|uniref:Uncharacterized protein n=1 Tax=Mycena pura TaxID=153505 RepID=A0AAD6Y6U9_9AGAR|nr:hypothetical protein GGX14DRAFT_402868 [Mycena pura]